MKWAALGLLAALAAGGCASQTQSIHHLPPEHPAADNAAAIAEAEQVAQAQAALSKRAFSPELSASVAPLTLADVPSMYTYDPWERFNRVMYRFDTRFDEAIFLPATNTYRRLPAPMRAGVHNFFDNLAQPRSVANYLLQLQFGLALRGIGRFAINTTVGIGGLLDVAGKIPLHSPTTGFADTLATWGMHPGPYLVIPILGPSTLRDAIGEAADYAVADEIDLFYLYTGWQSYLVGVISALDQRASIDFRYYETASPFEYELVRFLYVHRELLEDAARHRQRAPKPQNPEEPAGR